MKIAVIGSRSIRDISIERFVPEECTEIVSGGAVGIDESARRFAGRCGIKLTEFLPDYEKYGRRAPIIRNKKIVDYSDMVIAVWNGASRGTAFVIDYCKKVGKPCIVHVLT